MIGLGGCSTCYSSEQETGSSLKEGGRSEIEELVKSESIDEANKLIRDGHVFLAVYWNSHRSSEEYILGKIKKKEVPIRKAGFSM